MGEAGEEVQLYVYDLTGGMARALGQSLLRKWKYDYVTSINCTYIFLSTEKHIEGIWHTAIVVFGKEHFFGSNGISVCDPVSISYNHWLYYITST